MKFFHLFVVALSLVFTSVAHAQAAAPPDDVNQLEYIRGLSEADRLDKAGKLNELMGRLTQPASPSVWRAYADWLKSRVLYTDTREPMYYWAYSHLLRMANIGDTSALMYVTAVLMLETETARCADTTSTAGPHQLALLAQSELRANYWAQSLDVRQQARRFALQEEERKRQGPPVDWVCSGGMEDMIAAMKESANSASANAPKDGSKPVVVAPTLARRRVADALFDERRAQTRQAFDQKFTDEAILSKPGR